MLELVFKGKTENGKWDIYEIGNYEVRRRDYGADFIKYDVCKKDYRMEYLPEIYAVDDFHRDELEGFEIQTTSYGALRIDDIDKVINGLKEAQEVVKILENKFVRKEV